MKSNKIFGLLAVALCATAQIDARRRARVATRQDPVETSAPVATTVVTRPTSTPNAVFLTKNILDNLEQAANINSDVSTTIRQWMESYLTRTGAQQSVALADTAILGRLGSNPEYDACCKKCATRHKKASKKAAKPAKKETKKPAKKAHKHEDNKEHAKKK
jgi:hypothetical protein